MPFDAFLKIDGVNGESTDSKHQNEIELMAYSWGASQAITGTVSSVGNIAGQRVNMDELSVSKQLDSTSPLLAQHCAEGKVFPSAKLTLCRAGGKKEKYMEYKLTNAMIASVNVGGSSQGDGGVPTEEVGIAFTKIEMTYTKIGPNGTPQGNTTGSWDLAKNEK